VVDERQHQECRVRELLAQQRDRLGAVGIGQVDVGDDDVGIGLVRRPERCARGAADDLEVGLLLRQGPQALTDKDAAVHEEQLDDVVRGDRADPNNIGFDQRGTLAADYHVRTSRARCHIFTVRSPISSGSAYRWTYSGPLL
jgi:hypothetical protein